MFSAAYGRLKVGRQSDAEQQRRAHCDIRVPGRIIVELEPLGIHAGQHFSSRVQFRQIEYAIHQVLGQVVGNQELLHQPETDQEERAPAVGRLQKPSVLELWNQRR